MTHSKAIGILQNILVFVLPVVLLCFFLLLGYERSLFYQAELRVQTEQQRGLLIIGSQIESTFTQYVSDLLVVHNSNEFSAYAANPNETTLNDAANLLVRISTQKEYMHHQRFVNTVGQEVISVQRDSFGGLVIEEEKDLDQVQDSTFFQETSQLAMRVLYISDIFEKSNEKGGLQLFLTLALPVYQGSQLMGVLAIDFDACRLFSFLQTYQHSLNKNLHFQLVDAEGTVLLDEDCTCSDWNRPEPKQITVSPRLLVSDQGVIYHEGTVYSYQAVYPKTNERLFWATGPTALWTLVSSYSLDQIPQLSRDFLLIHPLIKYETVFLLALVGSILVVFLQLRRGDKQQMRISSLISDYATNGIVVLDAESRVTFCNNAFTLLCGYEQQQLIGKTPQSFRESLSFAAKKIDQSVLCPAWILHRDGNRYLTALTTTKVYAAHGNQLEHTIEMYSPSQWDVEKLVAVCEQFGKEPKQCFSEFEHILDPKTATAGISCLVQNSKEVGMQLNQLERVKFSQKLAEQFSLLTATTYPIYSTGFSSYLLFLTNDSTNKEVVDALEKLSKVAKELMECDRESVPLELCFGFALYPETSSFSSLLVDASLACKMQQLAKDGKYLRYNQDVRSKYQRHYDITQAIGEAFLTKQLYLEYQAQLSVQTNQIVGAEALVRWNHPKLGPVRPDEFLPILEQTGRMGQLGRMVITEAIQFLSRHQATLLSSCPNFSLSINLSAEELSDAGLVDSLGSLLREYHIPDKLLTVELTEHTAVTDLDNANSVLAKLKAQGISLAIDDFGTGFSSLSYLMELSADTIKVDRSFIVRYPEEESTNIYRMILMLAKAVGATVLAEGVETEDQLRFLADIGCDAYQGFLFSKAVDEQQFLAQLQLRNKKEPRRVP